MTEENNPNRADREVYPDTDTINPAAPLSSRRLLRSALTVFLGFVATKGLTLGQVFIITDEFGVGEDYDTFAQADRFTTQFARFLALGVIAAAFIPMFSGLLNQNNREGAWRLASQVFNNLLLATMLLCLVVGITAPLLVEHVLAPGFDAGEVQQTVNLLRILMANIIIFTLSSLLTGVLMGHNHFFLPMMAPIFQDLGFLFGTIFFIDRFGIYGLAWGAMLGAFLHFAVQVPGLFYFRVRWIPSLGWSDPNLREVVRLMIPRMLSSAVLAINFVAIYNINSRLGEGVTSAFDWGLRLMDVPEALIGTALAFAIFPTLAALTERGNLEERSQRVSEALRFIIVATIPTAAGMILLGRPALDILFVEPDEAALVYAAVQIFALAVIFQALHEIVARAFYAEKDTVTPFRASVAGMIGAITVLVVGFLIYENVDSIPLNGPLGAGLPALAYLTAFFIEVTLLWRKLRRQWGNLDEKGILRAATRSLAATVLMAIPVLLVDLALAEFVFTEGGRIGGLMRVAAGSVVGLIFFLIGAKVFDLTEVRQLPALIRQYRQRSETELAPS